MRNKMFIIFLPAETINIYKFIFLKNLLIKIKYKWQDRGIHEGEGRG